MFWLQVNIAIPPASEQSDVVIVRGTPVNVARGVEALIKRVRELDDEQEDRVSIGYWSFFYHISIWNVYWESNWEHYGYVFA